LARAWLELLQTISHNRSSRCLRNAWLNSSACVDDPERCTSSVAAALVDEPTLATTLTARSGHPSKS
jgi:hypothetical protein